MKVQARAAAGIAAAALGVLLTACGSAAPASSSATSRPTTASTTTPTITAHATQAAGPVPQFPNKDLMVLIDGYDANNRMVEFHLAVWKSGQVDDGTYDTDPKNPAAHRLAIAPDATLTSFSPDCTAKGGANTDGTHCTVAQFVQALGDDSAAGPAKLHVNAADQIESVEAIYHP